MKNVNNKGFSLIELMIVVAIIGILATVAIPNFQKFQGKAKQSEAKSQLGGFYMAQKAFFAEYNYYPGTFGMIGFLPQGNSLTYRITSVDNTAGAPIVVTNLPGPMVAANAGCNVTSAACKAPASAAFGGTSAGWGENAGTVAVPGTAAICSNLLFKAVASAKFSGVAANDEWSIDQGNILTNNVYGI